MNDTNPDVRAEAVAHSQQFGSQAMLDLGAPEPTYKALIEQGGFVEPACRDFDALVSRPERPMEGIALSFARSNTEFVLRHHELFSSRVEMNLGNVRPLIPLNVDPPGHASFRKLLDPLFAPRRMDEQEEDITRRANALIDTFFDRGECNFSEEFAALFPTSVFLGLMGLPEDELPMFLRLRDGILHPEKLEPDARLDLDKRRAVMNGIGQEIYEYFAGLIELRERKPAADIITQFLAAEMDGKKLSHEDILDICYLLLIAGLDTVSDSLTCFYAFLARNPDHRRQIVNSPALIPAAVEELLRWESPVAGGVPRVATQEVELPNGQRVDEGTAVVVCYGAANVDPAGCSDPFNVRFDREKNPHIAFGGGVHRCLGSHLARRELRVTLREWHGRIPEYNIKPGHEQLEYPQGLRHVTDLMLAWE